SFPYTTLFRSLGILGLILVGLYYLIERPIKSKKETTTVKKITWREVDKKIWIFVVIGLVLNVITKGLETWMPIYFLQAQHINLTNLAWLVPLPVIAG